MRRCRDAKMYSSLHKSNFDGLSLFSFDMDFASVHLYLYASITKGELK